MIYNPRPFSLKGSRQHRGVWGDGFPPFQRKLATGRGRWCWPVPEMLDYEGLVIARDSICRVPRDPPVPALRLQIPRRSDQRPGASG